MKNKLKKLWNSTGMILLWALVIWMGFATLWIVAQEYMTHDGRLAFNMMLAGYMMGNWFPIKSFVEDVKEDKKKEKHE